MKAILFFILFMFIFPDVSNCQNNAIRLNIKSLRQYDRSVVVNNDSIDYEHNPESNDNISFYDISVTYLKDLKDLKLFFGGGYNWSSSLYTDSRDVDTLFLEEKTGQKTKGFQVHFGILKTIPLNDGPFSINAGIGLYYDLKFFSDYSSEYRLTDARENYFRGEMLGISYTNRMSLGPNLEIGFYYTFLKNYSIGINHNTWFYWEYENGKNVYEAFKFGQNKSLTANTLFDHAIKRSIFGKSHYFSFSLMRKF